LPKCCAEHQKPDAFQRFRPTFQKLFLKSDFFDSFNGLGLVARFLLFYTPLEGGFQVNVLLETNYTLFETKKTLLKRVFFV
jgi:hypothetical protein